MNKRLKNTMFGALGFGLVFLLFELLLTLPFDSIFRPLYRIDSESYFVVMRLGTLAAALVVGALLGGLGGRIFAYSRPDRKPAVRAGRISMAIFAAIVMPLTATLFFAVIFFDWYSNSEDYEIFLISILKEISVPIHEALFGLLVGGLIALVFGLQYSKINRMGKTIWLVSVVSMAFALGGYLMATIAPLDLYLGRYHPRFIDGGAPLAAALPLLPARLLGAGIFGATGGAALAYFLDIESENN